MFILAASSLHHALKILSPASQKRVSQSCIAIPGLSFNHNALNVRKTCKYQLDHYNLNRNDVVIWHDAVNKLISRHRSNNFNALTPNQLKRILLNYKRNIYAIVFCKSVGTEDIYSKLKESGILVIIIVTDLISRRKQNLTELGQKYLELNQDPSLELKTFTILRRYSNNLKYIISKKKTPRPGKRKRQANRNRKNAEQQLGIKMKCFSNV